MKITTIISFIFLLLTPTYAMTGVFGNSYMNSMVNPWLNYLIVLTILSTLISLYISKKPSSLILIFALPFLSIVITFPVMVILPFVAALMHLGNIFIIVTAFLIPSIISIVAILDSKNIER